MTWNPRDKEQKIGRAHNPSAEHPPVDKWGRMLLPQNAPYPDWGRATENKLEAKRGLPSRVPGYGGYRTRKPSQG